MMLRLLMAGGAACLSSAAVAAALFVPDIQGHWPRPAYPFVDARSLQHDALAAGLDAAPGAPRPSADTVRFVVAPLAVPQFVWPARRLPGAPSVAPASDSGVRPGGINALVRVDGMTADVGDVSAGGPYRPTELADDLRALPPLTPGSAGLARAVDAQEGPVGWFEAPRVLVTITGLLLALSLLLAGGLLMRRPQAHSR